MSELKEPARLPDVRPSPQREEAQIVSDGRMRNLPVQFTTFIGREQQVTSVLDLLRRGDVRLVTLTGPGGVGKTRLAMKVAAEINTDFADGVFFVPLAPASGADQVVPIIADVLGIGETHEQPLLVSLKASLSTRRALLILDNFEHLLEAAPVLVELLSAGSEIKILATSRSLLHLSGEQAFPVPPLLRTEAVTLFCLRAQAVRPDFSLDDQSTGIVAEICDRLDGLPLAIELAAARVTLFPPQALLARLENEHGPTSLDLLTGGPRDLPDRHKALRNTLEWSYNLLTPQEQVLFRRLSVFAGGCTLPAAEAIAREPGLATVRKLRADSSNEHQAPPAILDGLFSLVDNSLIRELAPVRGEGRFGMLRTVREYGMERLAASAEEWDVRQTHATYFLDLVERAERGLRGPEQREWFDRLAAEHDNLRAALRWAIDENQAEIAVRLGGALSWFWWWHGDWSEGRGWIVEALGLEEPKDTPAAPNSPSSLLSFRAKALFGAGLLAYLQGDLSASSDFLEECLALAGDIGDQQTRAYALGALSGVMSKCGDYASAQSLSEQGVAISRELGEPWGLAISLTHLFGAHYDQGHMAEARAAQEEGLALSRQIGDRWGMARSLTRLARVALMQGEYARAESLTDQALVLQHQVGDRFGIGGSLENLAEVARLQGNNTRAATLYEQYLTLNRSLGRVHAEPGILASLASVVLEAGDWRRAASLLGQALSLAYERQDRRAVAWILADVAGLAVAEQQPALAGQLFGASDSLLEAIGASIEPAKRSRYDHDIATAREQLDLHDFAQAWAQGRIFSLDEAVGRAQELLRNRPFEPVVPAPKSGFADLTAREVEILCLLTRRLTDREMAEQLGVQTRSVSNQLYIIYTKLGIRQASGVSPRAEARRFAIEHGICESPPS